MIRVIYWWQTKLNWCCYWLTFVSCTGWVRIYYTISNGNRTLTIKDKDIKPICFIRTHFGVLHDKRLGIISCKLTRPLRAHIYGLFAQRFDQGFRQKIVNDLIKIMFKFLQDSWCVHIHFRFWYPLSNKSWAVKYDARDGQQTTPNHEMRQFNKSALKCHCFSRCLRNVSIWLKP